MKSNTTWKHTSPAARLSLLLAPKSLPSPMIPMICYRAWMMRWRRCWLSFAQIIQQLWPDRKWSLSIGNVSIKVLAQPSTPWRVGRSFTPRHHHWRCGSHMGSYASAESLKLWCLSHWSQVTTLRTDHLAVIPQCSTHWLTRSTGPQLICKLFKVHSAFSSCFANRSGNGAVSSHTTELRSEMCGPLSLQECLHQVSMSMNMETMKLKVKKTHGQDVWCFGQVLNTSEPLPLWKMQAHMERAGHRHRQSKIGKTISTSCRSRNRN